MKNHSFLFPTPANSNFGIHEEVRSSNSRSSTISPSPEPNKLTFEETSNRTQSKTASGPGSPAPGASTPGPSSHGSVTLGSPSSTSSRYDAKLLLNPRADIISRAEKRSTPTDEQNGDDESGPGLSTMLEKMHRLEQRGHEPIKRRKVDDAETGDDERKTNGASERLNGGGMLGDALKEERRKLQETLPLRGSSVVDLTAEEDGDDCVVVSQASIPVGADDDREVCLGRIAALASVHVVPSPSPKSTIKPTKTQWPAMRIYFRREHGVGMLIHIHDPIHARFGKLDARTAQALAPLMDSELQVRLKPSLDLRKRGSEQPGAATSCSMKITIVMFAPRKNVVMIGKKLSLHQVRLENTSATGLGVDLVNPHAPTNNAGSQPVASASTFGPGGFSLGAGYVTRTQEEVTADVMNMFDSITKTEDLPEMGPDPRITTELLSHQKQGLWWMTEREKDRTVPNEENEGEGFSLWRSKYKGNGMKIYYNVITGHESSHRPPPVLGGILADMMGLGKTLSILSLVVGSMTDALAFSKLVPLRTPQLPLTRNSKATLLVCPLSTVANWEEQIKTHIKPESFTYYVYHGPNRCQDIDELAKYDMVITSYHTLAAEIKKNGSKRPIFLSHWFRVVLDEAHQVRTQSTGQSVAVCAIEAQRRWAVTGTPIQNRLDDLGALIKFLRIKPFDQKGSFQQFIITPFKQADAEILPKLRLLVDSITLRRQKDHINLPGRSDEIVRLDFSESENKLYNLFLDDSRQKVAAIARGQSKLAGKSYAHVLKSITRLRLICAHGEELLSEDDRKLTEGLTYDKAIELNDDEDIDRPALNQKQAFEMLYLLRESDMDRCGSCDKKIGQTTPDDDDDFEVKSNTNTIGWMTPCYQIVCPGCWPKFMEDVAQAVGEDNCLKCPLCTQWIRCVWFELKQSELDEDERAKARVRANPKLAKQLGFYHGPHTKTKALTSFLKDYELWSDNNPDEPPIKSVIFSYWTSHLDLIQFALEENDFAYTRLDGSMPRKARAQALDIFRDDANVHIMLVSIGAGGLGLNLTTASKVFMMEPQFNPAAEAQAVERVHRLGQKRDVEIKRFIMRGSFEESVLELQRKKMELADLSLNRNVKFSRAEAAQQKLMDLQILFKR